VSLTDNGAVTLPAPDDFEYYGHTNALAIPFAHVVMEAYTNEDWVDSLVYLVTDPGSEPYPQMDLRGIEFEIMLRRRPADNEIILGGSSLSGSLTVGAAPNYGHLIWYFSRDVMSRLWPGQYVGDVVASDPRLKRVVLTVDLTLIQGITRS
jgi:hypothetical protein